MRSNAGRSAGASKNGAASFVYSASAARRDHSVAAASAVACGISTTAVGGSPTVTSKTPTGPMPSRPSAGTSASRRYARVVSRIVPTRTR